MIEYTNRQLLKIVDSHKNLYSKTNFEGKNLEKILDNFDVTLSHNVNGSLKLIGCKDIRNNKQYSDFNLFEKGYISNELLSRNRLDLQDNYSELNVLDGSQIDFGTLYSVVNEIFLKTRELADLYPPFYAIYVLDEIVNTKNILIQKFKVEDEDFTNEGFIDIDNLFSQLFNLNETMFKNENFIKCPRASLYIFNNILENFIDIMFKGRDLEPINQAIFVRETYNILANYQEISNSTFSSDLNRLAIRQMKLYFILNNIDLNLVNDAVMMFCPSSFLL